MGKENQLKNIEQFNCYADTKNKDIMKKYFFWDFLGLLTTSDICWEGAGVSAFLVIPNRQAPHMNNFSCPVPV